MLSVAIQKDIGEYRQRFFGGMTGRTAAFLIAAVFGAGICALALIGLLGMSVDDAAIPIMVVAAGVFMAGWTKPLGMPLEKAAPLLLRAHTGKGVLPCRTSIALAAQGAAEEEKAVAEAAASRKARKARKRRRRDAVKRMSKSRCPELEMAALSRAAERELGLHWTDGTGDWDALADVVSKRS